MVRLTSARPSGARPAAPSLPVLPAKMTSSIFPPRSDLAPCSPITQASASTTLDLPEPFGPTTHVTPGSKLKVVADANDLKPRSVSVLRCTTCSLGGEPPGPGEAGASGRPCHGPPTARAGAATAVTGAAWTRVAGRARRVTGDDQGLVRPTGTTGRSRERPTPVS